MMLKHQRYDLRRLKMTTYRIEVYWRADELGCGPCMSVYVGKMERLRFDLFDPAHFHVGTVHGSPRHYYPAGLTLDRYVELAMADLASHYQPAPRAQAWATEQLLAVRGPTVPVRSSRPGAGRTSRARQRAGHR